MAIELQELGNQRGKRKIKFEKLWEKVKVRSKITLPVGSTIGKSCFRCREKAGMEVASDGTSHAPILGEVWGAQC